MCAPIYTPIDQITDPNALDAAFEQVNTALDEQIAELESLADRAEAIADSIRGWMDENGF